MSVTIVVKGLSELQKFLDQLVPKMEQNVMRGGLRAGMKVVLPVAKQKIHSVSGELAEGLKIGTKRPRKGVVVASVKTTGPHASIARFVEFGTKAHFIAAGPNGGLRLPNGQVLSGVMHPGAAPHPFLRPALDSQATAAVIALAEYIKHRLATKAGLDTADVVIGGDE